MVQVAWSTSNLKVYTARDGSATVCESCCGGFVKTIWALTNENPPTLVWSYNTRDEPTITSGNGLIGIGECVGVDSNGNIIVGTRRNNAGKGIYKFDSGRNLIWTKGYPSGAILQEIGIDSNDNIYLALSGYGLRKINSDGVTQWDYEILSPNRLATKADGTSYTVNAVWEMMQRITVNGTRSWVKYTTCSFPLDIALDSSGDTYEVGHRTSNKTIWKRDGGTGDILDSWDTGGNLWVIKVDSSGNMYVGGERADNKTVWKVDSGGSVIWSYDSTNEVLDLVVDSSLNVYICCPSSTSADDFVKLDSSGNKVFGYSFGDYITEHNGAVKGVALSSDENTIYLTGYGKENSWG